MVSKAQIKANHKYGKKAYYRPTIMIRREYQEQVIARATSQGLSISGYVWGLIKKDLGIENKSESE